MSSRRLSWLLRHGATEVGLPMSAEGWCRIDEVLQHAELDRATFDEEVATNAKRRFQVDGERVRATQGHSSGVPVTVEALEASWERVVGPGTMVHGTRLEVVEAALAEGLKPMGRTHVHLADDAEATVGKRAGVAAALVVDRGLLAQAGQPLYRSPNGVLLTRAVPPSAFVDLLLLTKRARRDGEALRARVRGLAGA